MKHRIVRFDPKPGGTLTMLMIGCGATSASAQGQAEVYAPVELLEEVTVTARRREENLQEVPISITALTEAALAGKAVTSGFELQRAVPSLIASTSGNRTDGLTYSMRGQSNTYGSGGASVIVYYRF